MGHAPNKSVSSLESKTDGQERRQRYSIVRVWCNSRITEIAKKEGIKDMLLSKLVYLTVKNTIYFDDVSFTYLNFKKRLHYSDPDYSINIQNAYTPINEAIARLSDLERIPYRIDAVNKDNVENQCVLDLSTLERPYKEIIGLGQLRGRDLFVLDWRPFGNGKILIEDFISFEHDFLVEYKEDIKQFSEDDFEYSYDEFDTETKVKDIELKDEYGISDGMCNFIIEYAAGRLNEPISPEISNMHITRAEQYFNNIPVSIKTIRQKEIARKYGIE